MGDGVKYLTFAESRDLLKRLLTRHAGLHLLVTMTTNSNALAKNEDIEAAAAAAADVPLNQRGLEVLDANVKEFPHLVEMPKLNNAETAEVFFTAMMKSQQALPFGRYLARLGAKESVRLLEKHSALLKCDGRPGLAIRAAQQVEASMNTEQDFDFEP